MTDSRGRRDERFGDVEGGDAGTPAGQQPGVVPLATAQVQAQQPVHRRARCEEGGGGDHGPAPAETRSRDAPPTAAGRGSMPPRVTRIPRPQVAYPVAWTQASSRQ